MTFTAGQRFCTVSMVTPLNPCSAGATADIRIARRSAEDPLTLLRQ